MENDSTAARCAAIMNCAWWVRNCSRPVQKVQRTAAIRSLGLAVRQAFAESEDFEPLLRAVGRGIGHDKW